MELGRSNIPSTVVMSTAVDSTKDAEESNKCLGRRKYKFSAVYLPKLEYDMS